MLFARLEVVTIRTKADYLATMMENMDETLFHVLILCILLLLVSQADLLIACYKLIYHSNTNSAMLLLS